MDYKMNSNGLDLEIEVADTNQEPENQSERYRQYLTALAQIKKEEEA